MEAIEVHDGLRVRRSVVETAQACLLAAQHFIPPKDEPCGLVCEGPFNRHTRQCPRCGWLAPWEGPAFDLEGRPYIATAGERIREMPLGRTQVSRLGLTEDEAVYLARLGV